MLFCKHEWDKVSETTLPSAYEQAIAGGDTFTGNAPGVRIWRKVHVVILTCKKCGKVHTVRTENP